MKLPPIPRRMARLPRDERGYPIPVNVLIDATGKPQFTINDSAVTMRLLAGDLCPICGTLLARERWFVGGPLSAFHDDGAYIDLPMHDECVHFALAGCPYLAAPSYTKRIDGRKITPEGAAGIPLLVDATVAPERPEIFVAVLSRGTRQWDAGFQLYVAPVRPYLRVEYWRHGARLGERAGMAIAGQALAAGLARATQGLRLIRPGATA